jgi:hypothetical protein
MSTVAIGSIAAAGIGAASSIIGGNEQAGAAKSAQQLQAQEAQNALDFQKQQWQTQQQNLAPWLKAGSQAENTLSGLMGTPGQGLLTPWTEQFQAPTDITEQNDPGFQARLKLGTDALQNSAAAHGGILSGNTAQAITQYGQDYASNEYGNVYNRALGQYQQRYNIFEGNQANQFNRLSALAGGGQVAASQLGSEGQAAAGNVANIDLTTGAQQGQDLQNAAYQRASGYVGAGNAAQGALGNVMQLAMLQGLQNQGHF